MAKLTCQMTMNRFRNDSSLSSLGDRNADTNIKQRICLVAQCHQKRMMPTAQYPNISSPHAVFQSVYLEAVRGAGSQQYSCL